MELDPVDKALELSPHCGDRRNADSLLRKDIDLCVNSALHYLRPPMRGLKLDGCVLPSFLLIALELLPH